MDLTCKACGSGPVEVFYELENVPAQSVLNITSREKALAFPRGKIALGFCNECGFISNAAFEAELLEYDTGYEATQSYSETFNQFARKQAQDLIQRHNLHGKKILEIGCGNGEFLTLLCELGDNRGVGFDPAYVEGRVKCGENAAVNFVKDYYSEKYSHYKADFLYCKMTLEHIAYAGDFVRTVRRAIGSSERTAIFFQVPDVTRILKDCAFEDIYYEHCSYFSPGSLARLFGRNGFEVTGLETDYADQYVMIDSKPAGRVSQSFLPEEDDLATLRNLVSAFSEALTAKISRWQERIERLAFEGRRAAIWGSGSKGVSFLTTIGMAHHIQYAVDINPFRQGTFMAGTGHEIMSPEFMKEYRPDVVIVMNAVYREEIAGTLTGMNLHPEILAL